MLHIPPSYGGTAALPLVIVYHGFSLDAGFMASYTGFPAVADTAGFVAVFPNATGSPSVWNDTDLTAGTVDDVSFTRDLITKLDTDLCIDSERIFVAGYSNGGGMAQRVACDSPKQIAALALVEATYQPCNGEAPLVAFHGTLDLLVPFDGGDNPPERGGGVFPPVRRSISEWARNLGCDGLGVISRPANTVELTTYRRCTRGDGEVLLYALIGGGHTWAGAAVDLPPNVTGATNHDINATAVIWQFFSTHPLAH
jgi:polyhydroxybutyrate depolymerase